jgi:hypothetical protein
MSIEATYAPGGATLVGSGVRWLLIDADLGDRVLDDVWRLFARPGSMVEDVLEVLEKEYPDTLPSLVLADVTPGATESATRGAGRLTSDGDLRTLSLGSPGDPRRRLVGGVVSASVVRLRDVAQPAHTYAAATPAPAAPSTLITGVPPHILAARAPDPQPAALARSWEEHARSQLTGDRLPLEALGLLVDEPEQTMKPDPTAVPRAALSTGAPDPSTRPADHDGHATRRENGSHRADDPAEEPVEAPEHTVFRSDAPETVLAVHCPQGHLTPAFTDACRVCREPVPPQEPRRIPRPSLGVFRLPNGELVPVDRGIVFGRKPVTVPGGDRWPHLVHLPAESTYLSRLHLQVELDGWLVLVRDLGSQGGTRLHVPGRDPELLRAHESYVLEHDSTLDLADVYAVTFEVTG